ncbi:uncharacterized protein TNCV_2487881 [Trichonephila clavipes]|uniref:Uncharacterized protein n=1 Tax=Trichonephila clavipes TaxID=2585209 RepID=A0A8X7BBG4_TRICX|nr:uncharacterized protein TNCV_2487881 [Trichonephila clavipes]
MIGNYVNDQHDKWDQFLREFAYAIRTAVNETTEKTPPELFLGRKLITPLQKLVMVSVGTEKRCRGEEIVIPSTSGYNLRPRRGAKVESRPTNEKRTQQGGSVRIRGSREYQYSPYIEEQARSAGQKTRSRSGQQQH